MYLLFDIGGTNTRIALSKDGRNINEPVIFPTPQDFAVGIEIMKGSAQKLLQGAKVSTVAGGIPGVLDREKTGVIRAPNLKEWAGKPLKREFETIFNAPVFLENDNAFGGLGEAVYGAGKGSRIVAYIAIGTGVGGARIVKGKIDENLYGFEPGHQVICFDGEVCGCGGVGHLEAYISGIAIEKRYHKKPQEITDTAVWDETAKFLAYGLNNIIVHWSPNIIVLGGSMMKEVGIKIEKVEFYLKGIMKIFPQLPVIKKSQLGDAAGLWGALAYLTQKNLAN